MKKTPYYWPQVPERRGERETVSIDTRQINPRDTVTVMPVGLDQQGRYTTRPMPAEACTHLGADDRDADDEFDGARGIVIWCCVSTAALALIGFLAWTLAGTQ